MKNKEDPRVRLNLTVSPRVRQRLERLQEISDAESLTEVIRRALAVYEDLLEVRQAGGRVILERKEGNSELRVF